MSFFKRLAILSMPAVPLVAAAYLNRRQPPKVVTDIEQPSAAAPSPIRWARPVKFRKFEPIGQMIVARRPLYTYAQFQKFYAGVTAWEARVDLFQLLISLLNQTTRPVLSAADFATALARLHRDIDVDTADPALRDAVRAQYLDYLDKYKN